VQPHDDAVQDTVPDVEEAQDTAPDVEEAQDTAPAVRASAGATTGYVATIYLASLLACLGGGALAALGAHVWQQSNVNFGWAAGMVVSLLVVAVLALLVNDHRGWRSVACCLTVMVAVAGAAVFTCVLRSALDLQALRDRGVTETAVVTVEHVYGPSNEPPGQTYSYTLHALTGPPIRRDSPWSYRRLGVGEHITVLSDPEGEAAPSLTLHVSAAGQWQAAFWAAGVTAALLAVTAWTAPRPARRRLVTVARLPEPHPPVTVPHSATYRSQSHQLGQDPSPGVREREQ
jgi:hypothetical protein